MTEDNKDLPGQPSPPATPGPHAERQDPAPATQQAGFLFAGLFRQGYDAIATTAGRIGQLLSKLPRAGVRRIQQAPLAARITAGIVMATIAAAVAYTAIPAHPDAHQPIAQPPSSGSPGGQVPGGTPGAARPGAPPPPLGSTPGNHQPGNADLPGEGVPNGNESSTNGDPPPSEPFKYAAPFRLSSYDHWTIMYQFTRYKGRGVAADGTPPHPDQKFGLQFVPNPTCRANRPAAPCYRSNWLDESGNPVAGELGATVIVLRDGLLFTGASGGNPEGFEDAYLIYYHGRAPNDTIQPLRFTGTWTDVDGNTGTFTLVPQ